MHNGFISAVVVLKVGQLEDGAEDLAASEDAVRALPRVPVDELGPVIGLPTKERTAGTSL